MRNSATYAKPSSMSLFFNRTKLWTKVLRVSGARWVCELSKRVDRCPGKVAACVG